MVWEILTSGGRLKDFLDVGLAYLLRDLNIRIKYFKYIFSYLEVHRNKTLSPVTYPPAHIYLITYCYVFCGI